jgi:hypothetical protein
MYRIELTPGEVTVFRTIEELATGVRNGLITPKARIYHSASDKWLPIEFHPHYKQALDLNAAHGPDAAGHKHGTTASKHTSSKQGSSKSGGSKPRNDGLTFLNVPLSPVTPVPKPKPRVADLPYIEDDSPATQQPPARPSPDHWPSHAAPEQRAIEHSPAYEEPAESTRAGGAPVEVTLPVAHPPTHHSTGEHAAAGLSSTARPVNDAPIERSPGYDLDYEPPVDQPPAHQPAAQHRPAQHPSAQHPMAQHPPAHEAASYQPSVDRSPAHHAPPYDGLELESREYEVADHDAPAHDSPVEHGAAYEAAPAPHRSFKQMLADETPAYRSPAQRSVNHEATDHAAFEAHLTPEPIRIEEPIRDTPRSRLAVEELFAPPPPRAPSLPPVSASPVLELPTISYPEFTPAEPPVAERSSGGSSARRTLHLVGAVLLLAAGGYASTTMFSFGRSDDGFAGASTMADRAVVPAGTTAPTPEAAPAPARVDTRAATIPSIPAREPRASSPTAPPRAAGTLAGPAQARSSGPAAAEGPLPPASSGFAPALESRAIVNVPLKPAPKPDAVTDSSTIAPAIDMQVTVPELQGAESLAAPLRQKGDSAMKRILRAVSGKKDAQ